MKFIRNGLLTLLADDSKIYTFGVRNNMEIVLAFELPNNKVGFPTQCACWFISSFINNNISCFLKKGIVDYDLSIEAKHLVIISALGEKYVYDFY